MEKSVKAVKGKKKVAETTETAVQPTATPSQTSNSTSDEVVKEEKTLLISFIILMLQIIASAKSTLAQALLPALKQLALSEEISNIVTSFKLDGYIKDGKLTEKGEALALLKSRITFANQGKGLNWFNVFKDSSHGYVFSGLMYAMTEMCFRTMQEGWQNSDSFNSNMKLIEEASQAMLHGDKDAIEKVFNQLEAPQQQ
jgi:hypothetical protein